MLERGEPDRTKQPPSSKSFLVRPDSGGAARVTAEPDALERAAAFLREYILESHAEKHSMEQKAVDVAMEASRQRLSEHRIAHDAAHLAHEKIHEVAASAHLETHTAQLRAIDVAVEAAKEQLRSMNGGGSFARRETVDALERQLSGMVSRDVFDARFRELEKMVGTERERRLDTEGVKKGMGQTTAIIVGAIGLVGVILAILVVVINFATGTPS